MSTDNVIPLPVPDFPFALRNPSSAAFELSRSGLAESDARRVRRLVELTREQISYSISEREMLLEEDPVTGSFYRTAYRVTVEGSTEFEYRNAVKIVNARLSPSARVEVAFEKSRGEELPPGSIAVYPKEVPRA